MNLRSPKRTPVESEEWYWLDYYAGFSTTFVEDILGAVDLRPGAQILDPWNGAGTTTLIASNLGFKAKGFDLNPVMVLVAKARLSRPDIRELSATLVDICASARDSSKTLSIGPDPLDQWFDPRSVRLLRSLELAVRRRVHGRPPGPPFSYHTFHAVSGEVALLYVALFSAVRKHLTPFGTSNPTWIKTARTPTDLISVSQSCLHADFLEAAFNHAAVSNRVVPLKETSACFEPVIDVASVRKLPLRSKSVDAIISSPPYCTRIDYVIATLPELSLLHYPSEVALRRLRGEMVGTPTINSGHPKREQVGRQLRKFLADVSKHKSKASETYYLKSFRQYFSGMRAALNEIARVLRKRGVTVLVVQDSWYKDIHIDVVSLLAEQAHAVGLQLANRIDYPVSRHLARINLAGRQYRQKTTATESVLVFRRGTGL